MNASEPDRKALTILFNTYWSPTGWKQQPYTNPDDLAYAIKAGYMLPLEAKVPHDDMIKRVIAAVKIVDPERVANGFLSSLGTRRLELRSALGSYAVARVFPQHSFQLDRAGVVCPECGLYGTVLSYDRSVLNFERYKWGGVRHWDPCYCAFDLQQFTQLDVPSPSRADTALFRQLIDIAGSLSATARARDLEKAVGRILPSNKSERETLLDILGICGVLTAEGHPGVGEHRIPYRDRALPPASRIDWAYPIAWWRGGGVSLQSVARLFPDLAL